MGSGGGDSRGRATGYIGRLPEARLGASSVGQAQLAVDEYSQAIRASGSTMTKVGSAGGARTMSSRPIARRSTISITPSA
jgi:hypothetical protein